MLGKFIKDMAKYSLSQLLPALTSFITTPILTRLFLPAEYGNWALALSVSSFLVALTVSGLGSAIIRFYPAYKANSSLKTFFTTMSIFAGAITLFVAGAGYLIAWLFRGIFPAALTEYLPLILLIFIAQSIFTVYMAILRAQEKSGVFTTFQLLINYGSLGVGLLLVIVFGLRVDGLLWGGLLTLVFILPVLILNVSKGVDFRPQYFNLQDGLKIFDYAWPLALGNVAMWGLRLSDLFIISFFRTDRDVGLYTVSYNISAKSIELLVSLFLLSVSPLIMNTWEREGKTAAEANLAMVTRVYLVVCLPAVVGLSILAFPFVALLTAPQYYEGYKIFGLVATSSFAWGLANIAQMGMAIKKNTRRLGTNQILAASLHIILAVLLVPRFGYAAAAVTTLIGYTVLLILHTLASRPHLTWHFPFKTLYNVIFASMGMGLVAYLVYGLSGNDDNGSPLFLLLSILAAIPTYFILLWVLGEVKEKERFFAQQLWRRISGQKVEV
ncbi:lipopolysaccharide biosynthesis protein [Chloroflexota bacterium]